MIVAIGFIHILPDTFESLMSPCLGQKPWGDFLFTGLVAIISHFNKAKCIAIFPNYTLIES